MIASYCIYLTPGKNRKGGGKRSLRKSIVHGRWPACWPGRSIVWPSSGHVWLRSGSPRSNRRVVYQNASLAEMIEKAHFYRRLNNRALFLSNTTNFPFKSWDLTCISFFNFGHLRCRSETGNLNKMTSCVCSLSRKTNSPKSLSSVTSTRSSKYAFCNTSASEDEGKNSITYNTSQFERSLFEPPPSRRPYPRQRPTWNGPTWNGRLRLVMWHTINKYSLHHVRVCGDRRILLPGVDWS